MNADELVKKRICPECGGNLINLQGEWQEIYCQKCAISWDKENIEGHQEIVWMMTHGEENESESKNLSD